MRHFFSSFFLLTFMWGNAQNPVADSLLKKFRSDALLTNAAISIYAVNPETGEVLVETSPQLCIIPASVLKLVTTATAIEILGSDYRFQTTIRANGVIANDTLFGDLVITGGGDPTLGSGYFNRESQKKAFLHQWAGQVKKMGVSTITGNIIADPYLYPDQDVPQTWIWEDLGNYFGAAAQGITIYDNTFHLYFQTDSSNGGATRIVGMNPDIPGIELKNEVLASNDNRDRAYVYGSPFDSFRVIKGTLPKGRASFSVKASIPDPALLLAHELKAVMADSMILVQGVCLKEKAAHINITESSMLITQWDSPPLSAIIKQVNYESVNLFAEQLCKHLGHVALGEGSTQAGLKTIQTFWKEKGIDTRNLFMADGSGLSRVNAITAKLLTDILTYMQNNSVNFETYRASIPLTGIGGTQQYYFRESFLKGKAHAKSGSMTRVRSFAGYMTTRNNTPMAYTIIVNNFNGSSFPMAYKLEKLMEDLYNEF